MRKKMTMVLARYRRRGNEPGQKDEETISKWIHRTLQPATLRTNGATESTVRNLKTDDINISCIKATHNNRNGRMRDVGYSIVFAFRNRKSDTNITIKCGVSTATKATWIYNIVQINRISSRIMETRQRTCGDRKYSITQYVRA